MAFSMSYKGLTDRNIKYIYSDQTIRFVYPHKTHFRPLKEDRPLPPLKRFPPRFYDYYTRYDIGIPKAPAFRGTDPETVDRIVKRICKPIECQKRRRRDIKDENEADEGGDSGSGAETDRSDRSEKRTSRDIKALIARLQKPTESWNRKKHAERHGHEAQDVSSSTVPTLPPIQC